MNPQIIRAICDEIGDGVRETTDLLARRISEIGEQLDMIPAGAPGVGIKAIAQAEDLKTADIEFDNGTVIELQLPAGPKGDTGIGIKGDKGDTGQAPSVGEIAAVLLASPDFIAAATPAPLLAPPWQAGIHRAGTVVGHYIGRLYCAEKDTTAEPGESADWRRLGTAGMRHVGGVRDDSVLEPGDIYTKSASTFLFDGATHRLMAPRPFTAADAEKSDKARAKEVADLRAEVAQLRRQIGGAK
jgi:hypothetical protein